MIGFDLLLHLTKNSWFKSVDHLKSKNKSLNFSDLFFDSVELEGFEPSSKRGTNKVSTCLVSAWFSTKGRPETANLWLIL